MSECVRYTKIFFKQIETYIYTYINNMNRTKILKHPEGTLASERGQKVWLANGCVRAFKRSIAFLRLSCCGLFLAFCGFCF